MHARIKNTKENGWSFLVAGAAIVDSAERLSSGFRNALS